jgi:hypothetical protein
MSESLVLRKLDFPAYCIKLLDNGLIAISGGGGTSKTGVGNSIELGFIEISQKNNENYAIFNLIHKCETSDAIMKFVTFNFCDDISIMDDTNNLNTCNYIVGALDYSVEVFRIDNTVENLTNKDMKASSIIQKCGAIPFIEFSKTETISSLQVCVINKTTNKTREKNILLCVGSSKGNIIIWRLDVLKKLFSFEKVHIFQEAHSNLEVDGLEIAKIKKNENEFENHLLSIGKDNKCCLWSLDKLAKITELEYKNNDIYRIKHARFSSNYLITTHVPRIRGGSKAICSFIQKWSISPNIQHNQHDNNESRTKLSNINYKPDIIHSIKNTIITSIQICNDFVCLGDCDGKIYLFDLKFNNLINFNKQHSSVITDLAFLHKKNSIFSDILKENKVIVSISIDRTLQLYQYINSKEIQALPVGKSSGVSSSFFYYIITNLFNLIATILVILFFYYFIGIE